MLPKTSLVSLCCAMAAAMLGACDGANTDPAAKTADGTPLAFAPCRSCHAVEPGKGGIGPSLHGVFGTAAASIAGFRYSAALRRSGIVWDEATLDAWLTSPAARVPGTTMSYGGQNDPRRRKVIIAYLRTLK